MGAANLSAEWRGRECSAVAVNYVEPFVVQPIDDRGIGGMLDKIDVVPRVVIEFNQSGRRL